MLKWVVSANVNQMVLQKCRIDTQQTQWFSVVDTGYPVVG